MTDCERETMGLWEWGAFLDRAEFLENKKLWLKLEFSISIPQFWTNAKTLAFLKTFNQHTKISNSHRNKDNEQLPFLNTFAPVSLQYDIPFSKNIGRASAVQ